MKGSQILLFGLSYKSWMQMKYKEIYLNYFTFPKFLFFIEKGNKLGEELEGKFTEFVLIFIFFNFLPLILSITLSMIWIKS